MAALASSMKAARLYRVAFSCLLEDNEFKVVFLSDAEPPLLLLGLPAKKFYLALPVAAPFTINAYLDNASYDALRQALGKDLSFSPGMVFQAIDQQAPAEATPAHRARLQTIAELSPSIEAPDKYYFYAWRNLGAENSQPSTANLEKTMRFLGKAAYDYCKQHAIASAWTADPAKQNKLYMPWKDKPVAAKITKKPAKP